MNIKVAAFTVSEKSSNTRVNAYTKSLSSNGWHSGAFFKPEKNLEFFRLNKCPRDAYPGKLE